MFIKNDKLSIKNIVVGFVISGILAVLGIFWLDLPVHVWMIEHQNILWDRGTQMGAAKIWFLVVGSCFIAGWILKNKKITRTAFFVMMSLISASAFAWILKFGFGRMRPMFYDALGQSGFYPFTFSDAFHSFPSGHTVATFAGMVMLGLLFKKFKPLTWTLAVLMGVSRVIVGAHYPSDVIVGAFIGMVFADITYISCNKIIKKTKEKQQKN